MKQTHFHTLPSTKKIIVRHKSPEILTSKVRRYGPFKLLRVECGSELPVSQRKGNDQALVLYTAAIRRCCRAALIIYVKRFNSLPSQVQIYSQPSYFQTAFST